jgi:chromosome segregation ATPase
MNEQQRIKDDTRMVEDSLIALSKRVTQISSFITREMGEVNRNLSGSLDALHERSTNQANMFQQFSMTGYNNLALMLDEVMQQMQEQMAQSMPGSQMCQKPGGESQLPSMSEMQKQLNEQLQKMKGQMSEGPKPGQRQGMSQQLAEMAQQQAALREALQKMAEELGGGNTEDGKLAKQLQQIADQMDQTEEDIVNKRLTEETLRRQEEILTRLLEATESERERKMDDERKSNTAEELYRDIPPALEEYLRKRNAELDLYKTVAPELKPFYKNLVEEYFRTISFQ